MACGQHPAGLDSELVVGSMVGVVTAWRIRSAKCGHDDTLAELGLGVKQRIARERQLIKRKVSKKDRENEGRRKRRERMGKDKLRMSEHTRRW